MGQPYTTFFPGADPAWAWEPVIVKVGRKLGRAHGTVRDWVSANSPAVRGRGFFGQKPSEFCGWMFRVLGLQPDDEFHDLFPGSGAVTVAHEAWVRQQPLGLTG